MQCNVRDFGARGDGTANDTAAIVAANETARTNGGGYGTLFFPAGTYKLSPITIPSTSVAWIGENGAKLLGTGGDFLIRITGTFPQRFTRFENLFIDCAGVCGGICIAAPQIELKEVEIVNATVALKVEASIGHAFIRSLFAGNIGAAFVGAASSYAGFSVFDQCRLTGTSAAVYIDNTNFGPGGGNAFRRCWFEGFAGFAFFAKNGSAAYFADCLEQCWFENIATGLTADFSAVGGAASVAINGKAISLDRSTIIVNNCTAGGVLRNGSEARIGRYFLNSARWDVDASSVLSIEAGSCYNRQASDIVIDRPTPDLGASILMPLAAPKTLLDFSRANMLGRTGDCIDIFNFQAVAGISASFVDDAACPVFGKCIEMTFEPNKIATVYGHTDHNTYATLNNFTAGRWYVGTFLAKRISAGGALWVDFVNKISAPVGISDRWQQFGYVYRPAVDAAAEVFRIMNYPSSAQLIVRLSQIQVVECPNGDEAQRFMHSPSYAAANPDGSMRQYLRAFA